MIRSRPVGRRGEAPHSAASKDGPGDPARPDPLLAATTDMVSNRENGRQDCDLLPKGVEIALIRSFRCFRVRQTAVRLYDPA
ncbi:hypothetical protein GCM10010345_93300 [Streptomyces canarius]|uniref:Transposase n=1 Tax=Streptomyces canarius TaxID=285453 RepID=A0ABQ3DBQ0_9ACTN|nr:hypothetical protein GCM10010345_93300 [Streptomyces canarius]